MECTPSQVAAIKPAVPASTRCSRKSQNPPTRRDVGWSSLQSFQRYSRSLPLVQLARAPNPAVDARRTLNFATPGSTVSNRGSTVGTSALTAGTQFAATVAPRSSTQSVEDLIEQKVSAAIAFRELKSPTLHSFKRTVPSAQTQESPER